MLKQRLIALFIGIALTVVATGLTTVVADSLGFSVTAQVQAGCGGSGGGGC